MPRRSSALLPLILAVAAPATAAETTAAVTFDEAVAHALSRSPTLEAVAEDVQRAEALRTQTRAGWLPSLTANAAYTRLDADRVLNDRVLAAENQLAANLLLSVPLLAPQRWVQSARATEDVDVARGALVDARRTLAVTVARTFLSVIAQKRVVEIASRGVDAARAHQEFTHRRFVGQYGSRLDEVRASQELSTATSQLRTARGQLARLQSSLGALLGEERSLDAAGDPPLLLAPPSGRFEDDIEARADIELARRQVDTASHVVRDDWTSHAPALVGTLQPFFQDPATLTQPRTGWQAQLVLTVPLFEGGRRSGEAREHEAVLGRRRAQLAGLRVQAKAEVRAATRQIEETRAAHVEAQRAAGLAEEVLSLSSLSYREGATTNIEVVDAERRARDAATAAAAAEDAHRQALLDLLTATGRFPPR